MSPRNQSKPFLHWIEEDFILYFHWLLAIAPLLAIIIGTFVRAWGHYAEVLLGLGAILVNFVLLGVRSRIDENPELTLFRTFWSGAILPPSQPAKELLFNTEVAIIEAEEHPYFGEAVHQQFQKKLKVKTEDDKWEPDDDQKLRLTRIHCGTPDSDLDQQQQQAAIEGLKDTLSNAISKSEAVVVVRTVELDSRPWVIDCLHNWAKNDVEAPMLVVRPSHRKTPYKRHELMDKFWWIRDNAKSLPWNLVKRARDRAVGWRSQATYNRAMAINFGLLAVMIIALGTIVTAHHWEEQALDRTKHSDELETQNETGAAQLRDQQIKAVTVEDGMHEAAQTLALYQKEILHRPDENLKVSYWFRHKGDPYVFVTTERENTQNSFPNNKASLIGCGYVEPGRLVEWKEGSQTRVFTFSGRKLHGHGCEMDPRVEPIKAIVCSAYRPSGVTNPEATVGICVFTGPEIKPLLVGEYQQFLRDKTISFYDKFHTRIENKHVTALADRPKLPGAQ